MKSAPRGQRVAWICLYAVAMAAVESAVVVYLRALNPGNPPLTVLLYQIPDRLIAIEIGREIATVVMLLAVAVLADDVKDWWRRWLYFALAFGTWDIFYYIWLWVFIGWPPSLLTWDVLFLIPVPWLGPVLAPVLVSACLVGGALWLLGRDRPRAFMPSAVALAIAGVALIVLSFTIDFRYALARTDPPRFRWELFGVGLAMAVGAVRWGVGVRGSTEGARP